VDERGTGEVILVDADDRAIGSAGKVDAHEPPGLLHRALSAFVFDASGRLLLQRRAAGKYHFAGLWSNSCCTHPQPGEDVVAAGERRVLEELGIRCELEAVGTFSYQALDERSGLVEREVDHVLVATSDEEPQPDPREVAEVRFATLDVLRAELRSSPERYTPWLVGALAVLERHPASRDRPDPTPQELR
jgi:isopentenyl-diphosphate delta-isomerase